MVQDPDHEEQRFPRTLGQLAGSGKPDPERRHEDEEGDGDDRSAESYALA